ncbi:hypothetical protein QJQ45_015247, partial [Haematococcus lacustris]
VLVLDHNPRLTQLPASFLPRLTALRHLSCCHCGLEGGLPSQLGELSQLQRLALDGNSGLTQLPDELGHCALLTELSAAGGRISLIPQTFSQLTNLQRLELDSNLVSRVPPAVLLGCCQLWLLGLTANPITVEQLRKTEGWQQLEARRQAKANKQLEGRVLVDSTRSFEEGADSVQWQRWAASKRRL